MLVEVDIECPYCWENYPTAVDTSQGRHSTIEDCAVCCRPIQLTIECKEGEVYSVEVERG